MAAKSTTSPAGRDPPVSPGSTKSRNSAPISTATVGLFAAGRELVDDAQELPHRVALRRGHVEGQVPDLAEAVTL